MTGGEPPDQGWLMTRLTGSCAGLLYFCSVLPGSELKVLGCDLDPTLRESCAGYSSPPRRRPRNVRCSPSSGLLASRGPLFHRFRTCVAAVGDEGK